MKESTEDAKFWCVCGWTRAAMLGQWLNVPLSVFENGSQLLKLSKHNSAH